MSRKFSFQMLQFGIRLHNYDPWETTKRAALRAEKVGFCSLWLNDHLLPPAGPTSETFREAWTSLAALAALTRRSKIGSLVACNSFRNPALLAKMIASLSVLSTGRIILGIGAGWFEEEYRSYGIAFPSLGERMERLEESIQIIRAMLERRKVRFAGKYYHVDNALSSPIPKPRPPIWIGGAGRRLIGIAARLGDGWNCFRMTPLEFLAKKRIFQEQSRRAKRDPRRQTVSFVTDAVLAPTRRKVERLAERAARERGEGLDRYKELEASILFGTADKAVRRIEEFHEAGVEHLILNFPAQEEMEQLDYFGEEILPVFSK